MTTLLFDTLKLSKTLQEKGQFTLEQANALAEGMASASQDNLATKEDIKELNFKIAAVGSGLELKIEALRSDILKLLIGAVGLQTVVIIGALIALARLVK